MHLVNHAIGIKKFDILHEQENKQKEQIETIREIRQQWSPYQNNGGTVLGNY